MVPGLGFVIEVAVGVGEAWPESCFGPPAVVVFSAFLSPPLGVVTALCAAGDTVIFGSLGDELWFPGGTVVLWLAVLGTVPVLPVVASLVVAVHKDNTEGVRVLAGSVLCPLPSFPRIQRPCCVSSICLPEGLGLDLPRFFWGSRSLSRGD